MPDTVGEITKVGDMEDVNRSPLLPDRHATGDLFVCDIFNAAPKGDMASMEHPIFSLSTKPDTRIRRYENGPAWIEITPSVKGLATVHDRDVLIYCISQIISALNDSKAVSKNVRLKAFDLLVATNRVTDGRGYEGLKAALERLRGTTIVTNITTGKREELDGFGLIESFKIVRETRDGRMQEVEITLSDWVFNAIRAREVLTLNRDYFRLRKPLERRMYELARKHCGQQARWSISLELLQKKCGSNSTAKEFRRLVKTIVRQDERYGHFPDYQVAMSEDNMEFINRRSEKKHLNSQGPAAAPSPLADIRLRQETYDQAKIAAPGYDVYALEADWREWLDMQDMPMPHNPDAAFVGFCRKRHQRNPLR